MIKNAKNIIAVVALALATVACTKEENIKPSNGETPSDDLEEIDWDDPQPGQTAVIYVDDVKFEMVYVKKGSYIQQVAHYRTGQFGTRVLDTVLPETYQIENDYLIGKYEVTQRQWLTIRDTNPSEINYDLNFPVTNIWQTNMHQFVDTLKVRTGLPFRMPTLKEWQYAAMGGNKSLRYEFAGDNILNEIAWYAENSGGTIHPVGQLKPNELGIYDMCGNVSESTSIGDGYSERGGGFSTELSYNGSDYRDDLKVRDWYRNAPSTIVQMQAKTLGFRLAMDVPTAKQLIQYKSTRTKKK